MNKILKPGYINIALHILIWSTILLLPYLVSSSDNDYKIGSMPGLFFTITGLIHMIIFYGNAFYLLPKLFNRRYWWLYILISILLIMGSFQLKYQIMATWFPDVLKDKAVYRFVFGPSVGVFIISVVYRKVIDKIRFEKEQKEKQAEQLSIELKFLRSQISPHFIFNVMTNMVSLARQKSDLLEPSLIRLSELLRYMLYETEKDRFPVEAEIDYLKNYIALQQLRFGDDVHLKMDFQMGDTNCYIEPMLLIPFVENAFKHGVGLVKDPVISILLRVKEGHLLFRITNNYNRQDISKDSSSGIGLVNIKKRLNLLYAGRYKLVINDDNNIYSVELNLDLA